MTGSDRHFIGPFVRLHQADNVVVARTDVEAGTDVEGASYVVRDRMFAGHKIATVALRKGDPILKYNTVIGFAACDVPPGSMLHSHDIELRDSSGIMAAAASTVW
jgi:altronate hydrolase